MRGLILIALASCTYPVTNVVNEITETDASAAAQGVDVTLSSDSSVVTESDALQVVDSALPLAESGPDAGVDATQDAGPYAACLDLYGKLWLCGQAFDIAWGPGSSCGGQGYTPFTGRPCVKGETCLVEATQQSAALYGKCQ